MKKILMMISICFFPLVSLFAGSGNPQKPDIVTYTQYKNNVTTDMVRIDWDGDILPGTNLSQDLGESTHTWNKAYIDKVYANVIYPDSISATNGIFTWPEHFIDVAESSKNYSSTGFSVGNTHLAAMTTGYNINFSGITQTTGCARNIIAYSSSSMSVGLSTTTIKGYLTLYGIDSVGNTNSERINFSTASPSSFSNQRSSIAWLSLSSVTVVLSSYTFKWTISGGNVSIWLKTGRKLGLSSQLTSKNDVLKISDSGVNGSVKNIDEANSTYNPALEPNGYYSYTIWTKVKRSP